MPVNINRNKILCFVEIMASYIAIVTFVLIALHGRNLQWELFIDHYVSFSMLRFMLFVSFAATCGILLYARRDLIISLLKTNTFRYAILVIVAIAGVYFRLNAVGFIILLYAVYAILFINQSLDENKLYRSTHKLADHFLAGLFGVDSRTPALLALLLLISLPLLVILKKTAIAENTAVYFYYLLVITVVLKIMELKLGIERESCLLALLKDLWNAFYKTVTDKNRLTRSIIAGCRCCRFVFAINKIMYLAVLMVLLALIYAAKYMYWKIITDVP